MSSVQLLKSKKRAFFKSHLKRLGPKTVGFNSVHSSLAECLLNLNIWSENQTIASYRAMKGEISPTFFEQKCHKNPCFVFPQLRDRPKSSSDYIISTKKNLDKLSPKPRSLRGRPAQKMVFVPSQGKWELSPHKRANFFQPANQKLKPVGDIDIFLVPGLAFDREGRRLGRGFGHYDRFLAQSPGLKIGLAHHLQICNKALPEESHDIRMDVVVTDKYFFVPIYKDGYKNMRKNRIKQDFF